MADIGHLREGIDRSRPTRRAAAEAARQTATRDREGPPRTDIGTIFLHWLVAIAMVVSLLTGLRISADAPEAVLSKALEPILPQGEIWTVHFVASLVLFFSATAYALYMLRSGLRHRVALKKTRALVMPAASRLRWGAVNVILHWVVYGLVAILTATGIALYIGYGGWIVAVHAASAIAVLAYIFIHVVAHFLYGGWPQILRLFRPTRLMANSGMRARPLLTAVLVGVPVAGAIAAFDWGTRDTLTVGAVDDPPTLDGVLDDAAWRRAGPVRIRTQQGANLGGSGESLVEVRAVRDANNIYFAFRWQDPTRSLRRLPLIKREDGWHLIHDHADIADVMNFYEDKLSVIFSRSQAFGGGASTHLGPQPLSDKPGALNNRGLHYTTDGSYIDMWQWKASRGGLLGRVDDQFIGPPIEPKEADWNKTARYQGGYTGDPGKAFYVYNYVSEPPGGYRGPVQLKRLPADYRQTAAKLKTFDLDPDSSDSEGAQWWMMEAETVPYSPELDAAIPVGTVIPGVLIMGEYSGDRADIVGAARWSDGWWTLETRRALTTGSKYDVDFVPGEPFYMWVAVFDHTQTRHTRHVRPVKLVIE
ncbi:Thiosulfate reductase cytochrome b subunit [Chelatococcus sambhunathii]|uniref:Cytochrome c-552/DMSO reductase-like haem-binding domain-containing protein n=2 Tax=Chelatococcus TaxID=28209 RepID=A0AAC9JQH8_9HYPH|nr:MULTISPECIES: ethylbenzene dehydrogenase-related protein [Chelatococcus]APF37784.1 hypothetical protein BOQ54_10965 [Chelatococcus daeguensis]CUA85483.1 Thiosulfate reductase cytochrome b subunit [Chelatococcus sambhunathii]